MNKLVHPIPSKIIELKDLSRLKGCHIERYSNKNSIGTFVHISKAFSDGPDRNMTMGHGFKVSDSLHMLGSIFIIMAIHTDEEYQKRKYNRILGYHTSPLNGRTIVRLGNSYNGPGFSHMETLYVGTVPYPYIYQHLSMTKIRNDY